MVRLDTRLEDILDADRELKILRSVSSSYVMERFGRIFSRSVVFVRPLANALEEGPRAEGEEEPSSHQPAAAPALPPQPRGLTAAQAEAMYDQSVPSRAIGRFISHSWSAPRALKWLALAHHLHAGLAFMTTLALWLLATALTLMSHDPRSPWGFALTYSIFVLAPCLVLIALLVSGQHVFGAITGERAPGRNPVFTRFQYYLGCQFQVKCGCFLDKLCIHQADMERKLQGVSNLGTFMRMSETITALWSEDYFERLWCIFEIAVFAGAREGRRCPASGGFEILPLWKAPFLYSMLLINVVAIAGRASLQGSAWWEDLLAHKALFNGPGLLGQSTFAPPVTGIAISWVVVNAAPAVLTSLALRYKFLEHSKLYLWVSQFSLLKTRVTDPTDRDIVYSEIEKMYGSTSGFEKFVRGSEFFGTLRKSLGGSADVPYRWGLMVFLPYVWYASADGLSHHEDLVIDGMGNESWEAFAFGGFAYYLGVWLMFPFCLKGMGLTVALTGTLANWTRRSGSPFKTPSSLSQFLDDVHAHPLFYVVSICGTLLDAGTYLMLIFLAIVFNVHLTVAIMAVFGYA